MKVRFLQRNTCTAAAISHKFLVLFSNSFLEVLFLVFDTIKLCNYNPLSQCYCVKTEIHILHFIHVLTATQI